MSSISSSSSRPWRNAASGLGALVLLGGCSMQVLDPAGDVARQQADLLIISTILMLLIIVPVMALTIIFAWRYRASSPTAEHRPDWDHSTALELVIWSAPLLIIIALGAITWISTHTLDPYRRLGRIAPGRAIAAGAKPLEIDVVALDWKWLFIYPEQGIATVNQLALPVDREVRFRLTASSVMNSFYVPMLAGQVYAMPGMETKLHAVLNRPGRFEGFSANYSGAGFSGIAMAIKLQDAGIRALGEHGPLGWHAGQGHLFAARKAQRKRGADRLRPCRRGAVRQDRQSLRRPRRTLHVRYHEEGYGARRRADAGHADADQ